MIKDYHNPLYDAGADTAAQKEAVEALREHGGLRKACEALGRDRRGFQRLVKRIEENAARLGYAPGHFNDGVAPGYHMGKVTVQRGANGQVERVWERQSPADKEDNFRQAIEALCEPIDGFAKPICPPKHIESELLTAYPMGDPHFGLKAWAGEVGEDFDLPEAERRTCAAIDRLVSSTPQSETGLLVNLGDMFHANDESASTPASNNRLDVDTRHSKVLDVTSRAMVYCIQRLLEKHKKVIVWNVRGNHDPDASMALAAILRAYFRNEPRAEIPYNPSLFSYHRHGKVLIGATHGHGPKFNDLPLIMATDRQEDWGGTNHRHWLVGHIHHKQVKEHPGCVVESFNTLAGSDAWHHGKGYRAKKNMQAIVFHEEHGELQRHICDFGWLKT